MCKENDEVGQENQDNPKMNLPDNLPTTRQPMPIPEDPVIAPKHQCSEIKQVDVSKLAKFEDIPLSDVNETRAY